MIGWLLTSVALAWPAGVNWVPLERDDAVVVDADDDGGGGALEIIGTEEDPALQWWADSEKVYWRVRFAGDPLAASTGLWGVVVETDGALTNVEAAVLWDAATGDVSVLTNDTAASRLQPGSFAGPVVVADVRSIIDGSAVWLDLAVTRADLASAGMVDVTELRFAAVVGADLTADWTDESSCDHGGNCSAPRHSIASAVTIDGDEDGLSSAREHNLGLPSDDADADDDGLLDGEETLDDVDNDDLRAVKDCDDDGDGLPDGLERGVTAPHPDTDTSVCFRADLEPSSTTAPADPDSDGGGLTDGQEDADADGKVGPWETDPNDGSDDVDSDGDGIPDVVEFRADDGDATDEDSDGDGWPDSVEGLSDPDGDGLPSFIDADSDGDGISDKDEGPAGTDTDGDGVFDFLDDDSDGDGVSDLLEGGSDLDGDGVPNFRDDDADGDGRLDVDEGTGDGDCDGLLNFEDALELDGPCGAPVDDAGVVDTAGFSGTPLRGRGDFTGGGCSHGGVATLWPMALLLLLWRRRAAALVLLSTSASAQELDALRFTPTARPTTWVGLDDGQGLDGVTASLWTAVTDDALVFRSRDGLAEVPLLHRVTTGVLSVEGRRGDWRLSAAMPLHGVGATGAQQGGLAAGDLRVGAGRWLLRRSDLAVGVSGVAVVPTGASDRWLGAARTAGELAAEAAGRHERLGFAARVGARMDGASELSDFSVGNTLLAAAGVSLAGPAGLSVGAELQGGFWLGNMGQPGAWPLLGRASLGWVSGPLQVRGFVGRGLSSGIGAPDWQAGLGLAVESQPR